jgi:hypothetical protein
VRLGLGRSATECQWVGLAQIPCSSAAAQGLCDAVEQWSCTAENPVRRHCGPGPWTSDTARVDPIIENVARITEQISARSMLIKSTRSVRMDQASRRPSHAVTPGQRRRPSHAVTPGQRPEDSELGQGHGSQIRSGSLASMGLPPAQACARPPHGLALRAHPVRAAALPSDARQPHARIRTRTHQARLPPLRLVPRQLCSSPLLSTGTNPRERTRVRADSDVGQWEARGYEPGDGIREQISVNVMKFHHVRC